MTFVNASSSISYGVGTLHVGLPDDWVMNENNKMLLINVDSLIIGKMTNSFYNQSYMLGVTTQNKYLNYSLVLASGYESSNLHTPVLFGVTAYPTISLATPSYNNVSLILNYSGIVFTGAVKINF